MSKTAEVLQDALAKDPKAVTRLISTRIACTEELADDPYVQVGLSPSGGWQVGALGLINAVLAANNLPLVAAQVENNKVIGFCEYIA